MRTHKTDITHSSTHTTCVMQGTVWGEPDRNDFAVHVHTVHTLGSPKLCLNCTSLCVAVSSDAQQTQSFLHLLISPSFPYF